MVDSIDDAKQFIVFRLYNREYALPISQTIEVLRMVALSPLSDAPCWLAGMINVRGQVLPVIDLRARLALPQRPPAPSMAIIVAQDGDTRVGLITDLVAEILTLPAEAIAPLDRLAGGPPASVAHVGGRLITLLNLHELCADTEQVHSSE